MTSQYVDTNIFIRFFIADIPSQFAIAEAFFTQVEQGQQSGLVSILVVNEIIWIMEHFYHLKRSLYLPKLLKLLSLKNLRCVEIKKEILIGILEKMQASNIDFTDAYLSATAEDKPVLSFDRDLRRR
jgi:predicted nucleic acid-binding protein